MIPQKKLKSKEKIKLFNQTIPKSNKKEDILNWLYQSRFVSSYLWRLCNDNDHTENDDFIQEIWLALCELPQEKYDDLCDQGYSTIKSYVSGMIWRQVKSGNSPIYTKYKKRKKREKRLSQQCWDIYAETNVMPIKNDYD